jgi:hypothetical protein
VYPGFEATGKIQIKLIETELPVEIEAELHTA